MKDGLIDMCGTEYSDMLDTAYYDVVEDIIGDAFGCSESSALEPLLGKTIRLSLIMHTIKSKYLDRTTGMFRHCNDGYLF